MAQKTIIKVVLLLLLSKLTLLSFGQNYLYIDDPDFVVDDTLFVGGNLIIDANGNIDNRKCIYLDSSLYNKSNTPLFEPSSYGKISNGKFETNNKCLGDIYFQSDTAKYVANETHVLFANIYIENDTLLLNGNKFSSLGLTDFENGLFNLNGEKLSLYYYSDLDDPRRTGYLAPELDKGRIIDTAINNNIFSNFGYIEAEKNIVEQSSGNKPTTANTFKSIGIEFTTDNTLGVTKIKRYHYSDSLVTQGSINKVFHLDSVENGNNFSSLITLSYVNSSDLQSGTKQEDLWVWYSGPADSVYSTNYTGYKDIFYPSEIGDAVPDSNTVSGEAVFRKGYKYTLAPINCDNTPPVDLGDTVLACVGSNISLKPFADSIDFQDYFYRWHAPDSVAPYNNDKTVNQFVFKATEKMVDSIFTISVDVRDVRGCRSSDSVTVVIKGLTYPEITTVSEDSSKLHGTTCAGQLFYLIDTANKNAEDINYTWILPNDSLKNENHQISYTLNTPGNAINYKVLYTNEYGCTSETNRAIKVNPLANIDISANAALCQGSISTLVNNTTIRNSNPVSAIWQYSWSFTGIDSIFVNVDTRTSSNDNYFHSPFVSETNQNPNLNYRFDTNGWVDLTMQVVSREGCVSNDTFQFYINPTVIANFDISENTNVCANTPSLFYPASNSSQGDDINYNWKFSDVNRAIENDTAQFTYTNHGSYPVQLIVKSDSGCVDTIVKDIEIYPVAKAFFTAQNHCLDTNSLTVFTKSTNVNDNYYWNYGNGLSDSVGSVNYLNAGIYNVQLTANNQWNCADSLSLPLEIYPLPNVSFLSDTAACLNAQNKLFTNTSTDAVSFTWTFDDDTYSSDSTPDKIYNSANTYMVTLEGVSRHGCSNKAYNSIQIHPISEAAFDSEIASVCEGTESAFILTSGLSNLAGVTWKFGNGQEQYAPYPNPNINYQYPTNGYYQAKAITHTTIGCSDTASATISIAEQPNVTIEINGQACVNSEIVFEVSDTSDIEIIDTYQWNFGDAYNITSNTSSAPAPSHFYTQADLYTASLSVVSERGCYSNHTRTIQIGELPTIAFDSISATCATTLELIAGDATFNYLWSDGSTNETLNITENGFYSVTASNPTTGCSSWKETEVKLSAEVDAGLPESINACDSTLLDAHNAGGTYIWSNGQTNRIISVNSSGTYWVNVTDINECTGTDTVEVNINNSPQINLPPETYACNGDTAVLAPGIVDAAYEWSTSSNASQIAVRNSGYYWVEVNDNNGCSDNAYTNVIFNAVPMVYLGENRSVCEDQLPTLSANNPGCTYLWSNGAVTQAITPASTDLYSVEVINEQGCSASDSVWVQINALPVVNLGENQSLCQNQQLVLSAGVDADLYHWSNNSFSESITVNEPGEYWVRVIDSNNCSTLSESVSVSFRALPLQPFNTSELDGCNYLLLDASHTGAIDYNWHDGHNGPSYNATNSGNYWLEITNSLGCSLLDSVMVTINPMAIINLDNDISICDNGAGFIDAGYFGEDYTYQWNTGSTEQFIRVSAEGNYSVEVSHIDGCVASDSAYVSLDKSPVIDLGSDAILCKNSGLTLDAGTPGSAYFWGSSNGLTSAYQTLEVADTGKYWVYVIAPNGCSNSDSIDIIHTNMSIEPLFMCASNIRIGDTVRFVDLSVPDPTAYHWSFGDFIASEENEPTHIYYAEQDYTVTMTAYNNVCSASVTKTLTVEGYNPYYLNKMAEDNLKPPTGLISIDHVKIYPNPTSNNVMLELEISESANIGIYVYNINGQLLHMEKHNGIQKFEQFIDLSNFYEGMYFVRVVTVNEAKTFKVLKTR